MVATVEISKKVFELAPKTKSKPPPRSLDLLRPSGSIELSSLRIMADKVVSALMAVLVHKNEGKGRIAICSFVKGSRKFEKKALKLRS